MDWLEQAARWLRDEVAQAHGQGHGPANALYWPIVSAGLGISVFLTLAMIMRTFRRGRRSIAPVAPSVASHGPQSGTPAPAHKPPHSPAPSVTPSAAHAALSDRGVVPQAKVTLVPPSRRASGVANENEQERNVRVFISSTFRDMRDERQVLADKTFPALKRAFRAWGVQLQEVDLRWGVNRGDFTLDICLAAVRRCNWFIGLIGQRYGAVLDDAATIELLKKDYSSVSEGLGRSLTEIEILEGALGANRDKQVLFFERDRAWLDTLAPSQRPEFEEEGAEAQRKLADLRARIGARVREIHEYRSPEAIDGVLAKEMTAALERTFPPLERTDDPFVQEHRLHVSYARERLGIYVGGESYVRALDAWMAEDSAVPQIAIGASGGGKSTLIAQWTTHWSRAHPEDIVFAHYLGASPSSADPRAVIRRLWLHLNRVTGEEVDVPNPDAELKQLGEALIERLGQISAIATRENCRVVIALDGLDKLAEENRDLRWWPRMLPPRVKLLVSSLDGKGRDAAGARGWREVLVKPFDARQQAQFVADTLRGWNKSDFPEARKQRVLAHPLAGLPLFLKAILEELRISAANSVLDARLDDYLQAPDMPQLFARILRQIASECGEDFTASALSLIWASRAGLEEGDIVAISRATSLAWERLRNRLADNLRDAQGRVAFSHDYLRGAIATAYLSEDRAKRAAHLAIADRFEKREADVRQAEEVPYQLRAAGTLGDEGAWARLEALLVDLDRFSALRDRGGEEMLSYWLPLKARGKDPEAALVKALDARLPGEVGAWRSADIDLAEGVADYLFWSGYPGARVLDLQQRIVAAGERLFDPKDKRRIAQASALAGTLFKQGDARGAIQLVESAYYATLRARGPEDKQTIVMMSNFASYLQRIDPARSEDLFERALEISARVLGPEDETTIHITSAFASHHSSFGNPATAAQLFLKAIEGRKHLLGASHPLTLYSQMGLAMVWLDLGRVREAETLMRAVIEGQRNIYGDDHGSPLVSLSGLAEILFKAGDFDQALRIEEGIVETRTRVYGLAHHDTIARIKGALDIADFVGDLERVAKYRDLLCRAQTG